MEPIPETWNARSTKSTSDQIRELIQTNLASNPHHIAENTISGMQATGIARMKTSQLLSSSGRKTFNPKNTMDATKNARLALSKGMIILLTIEDLWRLF